MIESDVVYLDASVDVSFEVAKEVFLSKIAIFQ